MTKGTERGAVIYPPWASLSSGGCISQGLEHPALPGLAAGMGQRVVPCAFAFCCSLGDGGAEPVGMCKLSKAGGGLCPFLFPGSVFSAKLSLQNREDAGRAMCCCTPSQGDGVGGGSEPL